MTNMKKILALGAAVALVSCARFASAQDDLDALLNDLESDNPAAENAAAKPAEDGAWTCKNGHGGNTGKFCSECGAPKE